MAFKCDICNKNFESEDSFKQHNLAKHASVKKKTKVNLRKYIILGLVALIIIFIGFSFSAYSKRPGDFDSFAKCLTEKGVVVYGNDYCSYTTKQLGYFGKSKSSLNYVKCAENQKLCDEKEITITPTWEIEGKMYKQVQTFEKLSLLSGCEI